MIYLKYLKRLILENKLKFLLILFLTGSIHLSFKLDKNYYSHEILSTQDHNGVCYFLVDKDDSLTLYKESSSIKVIDNNINYIDVKGLFIILIVISIFGFFVLFALASSENSDENFGFYDNWIKTNVSMVKLEVEDDNYYYVLRGRLIASSQKKGLGYYDIRSVVYELLENDSLNLKPKFKGTKNQIRDKKLSEILK
jgi:hypothetical protein